MNLEFLIETAHAASREILAVYEGEIAVDLKDDRSPLTEADRRSNAVILERLAAEYPDIPVITEENAAASAEQRATWSQCFLIDPLDGTKEFIKRNGEFTVNIALIENGVPIAGVVQRPTTGEIFAAADGQAFHQAPDGIETPLVGGTHYSEKDHVVVVGSRSHNTPEVDAFVADLKALGKTVEFISSGSSLKICLVASGQADVYPRFGPTMEWDTAAADAVARAAGRRVLAWPDLNPLAYNKPNLLNPFFIVE